MNNTIIVIVGPTAVGKTKISIELAKKLKTDIISADSMQIYKYMNIGTAKVTEAEAEGIQHHMIDLINPDEKYSVSNFKQEADMIINDLLTSNKIPVIVGGSGLYVNSLIYDLDFGKVQSDESIRKYYMDYYNKNGKDALYNLLKELDIDSANKIHKNNVKRVVRALEYCKLTGEKFSLTNTNIRKPNNKYNCIVVGLTMDRNILYSRINQRVDIMIKEGLINEVKNLLNMGYTKDLISMQGIGYKEIIEYLCGNVSLDESIETLKTNTRRFAKRQYTWFNRDKNIKWFNLSETSNIQNNINTIYEYVTSGGY